ncbi:MULTISPECIES: MarR family winged helix-turn-helix transcriptional regulator [Streptomycetaceae]|uniref:Transcriptional regulator, MarR family n=1 Tax=Streptantibioticus cattleyicolor (strain ATCC 35852 / DSM 46488 / JCM 4925 / NBRC 14057 / NRRL 8057) TaxID=1003195 RepID=F8JX93_STREN|nr:MULTISPECIES: MarR family transcriptional regulator [Streptomycetaceae]AEW94557.1 transcriptional regulator, MarR family [Streptantibioticus cattleyicolor NRRL 8057 = DSM 46488]MYS59198.1 MarR family transcriptional regulator [Streptomyces sp. SID5468]CCB74917.1 putative MarR-family transcriptional regulator [Streptantibioticus cattleyicolor NRRL 8057 = DSM 46488]
MATTEPRWLDERQQKTWRAYMAATQLLSDHIDRQLQRDSGMPHTYYSLLVWLSETPGRRMRMTELAERSKITRSRLSHAISRLEKDGWVRREDCATDRRGQMAVLTEQGFKALRTAAPGHVEAVRTAVFDRLTEEQVGQLGEIMRTIAEGLAPQGRPDLPWLR